MRLAAVLVFALPLFALPALLAAEPRSHVLQVVPRQRSRLRRNHGRQIRPTEYKEDPKDDGPLKFQLKPAERSSHLLELSDRLEHFTHPVESGLKVANMGTKTFRYDPGDGASHEVKFNYSEDPEAKTLLDWFERISETERGSSSLRPPCVSTSSACRTPSCASKWSARSEAAAVTSDPFARGGHGVNATQKAS